MTSLRASGTTRRQRPPRQLSLPLGVLRAARPRQWVKNLLVVAAPAAAGVLTTPESLLDTALAFVAFCLAASGSYLVNDTFDAAADGRHPRKCYRPVAAGTVPIPLARALGSASGLGGVGTAFLTGTWQLPAVVAAYLAVTMSYTCWLKHIPVVDLVSVATGFVLRALGGAAAVEVPVSSWFFIVASLGSLFIVGGKRESELRNVAAEGTRPSLEVYSHTYLTYVRAMSSGAAVVAYGLWAVERDHMLELPVPLFALSIVPFLLAILRYAMLVDAGAGESPEELLLRDRPLQIFGVLLVGLVMLGIYAP